MKKLIFLFAIILNSNFVFLYSQNVRPIKDSIGFCWNADEMNRFIMFLEKHSDYKVNPSQNLIGAISVHDDYLYAGKIYYPLYKLISAKEVVIFGVTHGWVKKELGAMLNEIVLDEFDEWQGTYSNVSISPLREIIKSKLEKDNYIVSNKAHSIEHSIEALIPFLQHYNRKIKITPIMITKMTDDKLENISSSLSKIISGYIKENNMQLGKDIFFLISNDANHYGEDFKNYPYGLDLPAHKIATENDKRIIEQDLVGNISDEKMKNLFTEILPDSTSNKITPLWCGRYPIALGLLTINKIINDICGKTIEGKLFSYSDTMTEKVLPFENTGMGLTAIFSPKHWCGWFTLGLYQK